MHRRWPALLVLVATIVGSVANRAEPQPAPAVRGSVATGIDVLVKEDFRRLKGRRVGLVTNHTGRDKDGRPTIDLLHKADGIALFSPEHGIRGAVDEKVADATDERTGLVQFVPAAFRRA